MWIIFIDLDEGIKWEEVAYFFVLIRRRCTPLWKALMVSLVPEGKTVLIENWMACLITAIPAHLTIYDSVFLCCYQSQNVIDIMNAISKPGAESISISEFRKKNHLFSKKYILSPCRFDICRWYLSPSPRHPVFLWHNSVMENYSRPFSTMNKTKIKIKMKKKIEEKKNSRPPPHSIPCILKHC